MYFSGLGDLRFGEMRFGELGFGKMGGHTISWRIGLSYSAVR